MICFYAPANSGKTSSIRKVSRMLDGTHLMLEDDYDFVEVIDKDGIRIGLSSKGDPNSNAEGIKKLIKENCGIIVCASRTRGGTVDIVQQLAKENDFKVIWLSPISIYDDNQKEYFDLCHTKNEEAAIAIIQSMITGSSII